MGTRPSKPIVDVDHFLPRGKPLVRMQRKAKVERTHPNVAVIDFGTTNCSVAYATNGDPQPAIMKFDQQHPRVPTALLLLKNDDGTVKIKSFGQNAMIEYTKARTSLVNQYIYFERVKMNLKEDELLELTTTVEDSKHDRYYLVEVVGLMLNCIKDQLISRLSMTGRTFVATDFNWVITIPAIWKGRGKQLMREAAYRAGLCSERQICSLTPVPTFMPLIDINEVNEDKLTLFFEPEAAAIYCQKKGVSAEYCDQDGSFTSSNYMVVDIGGGTVDLAVHHIDENGKMEVLTLPQGNDCGGTRVNREFETTLRRIVGEEIFSKLSSGVAHRDLLKTIYGQFEEEKLRFGNTVDCRQLEETITEKYMSIEISGLLKHARNELTELALKYNNPDIKFDEELLIINYSKAIEFFKPSVDAIVECVQTNLNNLSRPIDTIYLVGGFGGCRYIYSKIKELIATQQDTNLQQIRVFAPNDYKLAVVEGAALSCQDSSLIKSRPADATYGISVSLPFKPGYREQNRYTDSNGQVMCRHVFAPCVLKGEELRPSEVFVISDCIPINTSDNSTMIYVFRSDHIDVQYTPSKWEEEDGSVHRIGVICVPLRTKEKGKSKETSTSLHARNDIDKLNIELCFGSTEIQTRVTYVGSQDRSKDIITTINYF